MQLSKTHTIHDKLEGMMKCPCMICLLFNLCRLARRPMMKRDKILGRFSRFNECHLSLSLRETTHRWMVRYWFLGSFDILLNCWVKFKNKMVQFVASLLHYDPFYLLNTKCDEIEPNSMGRSHTPSEFVSWLLFVILTLSVCTR